MLRHFARVFFFFRRQIWKAGGSSLNVKKQLRNYRVVIWRPFPYPGFPCRGSCESGEVVWSGGCPEFAARAALLRSQCCYSHCCKSTWCHELPGERGHRRQPDSHTDQHLASTTDTAGERACLPHHSHSSRAQSTSWKVIPTEMPVVETPVTCCWWPLILFWLDSQFALTVCLQFCTCNESTWQNIPEVLKSGAIYHEKLRKPFRPGIFQFSLCQPWGFRHHESGSAFSIVHHHSNLCCTANPLRGRLCYKTSQTKFGRISCEQSATSTIFTPN